MPTSCLSLHNIDLLVTLATDDVALDAVELP